VHGEIGSGERLGAHELLVVRPRFGDDGEAGAATGDVGHRRPARSRDDDGRPAQERLDIRAADRADATAGPPFVEAGDHHGPPRRRRAGAPCVDRQVMSARADEHRHHPLTAPARRGRAARPIEAAERAGERRPAGHVGLDGVERRMLRDPYCVGAGEPDAMGLVGAPPRLAQGDDAEPEHPRQHGDLDGHVDDRCGAPVGGDRRRQRGRPGAQLGRGRDPVPWADGRGGIPGDIRRQRDHIGDGGAGRQRRQIHPRSGGHDGGDAQMGEHRLGAAQVPRSDVVDVPQHRAHPPATAA
jgi:hypothetical protein